MLRTTMRVVIVVSKSSYGYVLYTNGHGRGFTRVIGSHHPEPAAEAALAAWEEHRNHIGEVTIEVPQEVEAIIKARGSIPWARQSREDTPGFALCYNASHV